MIRFLFLFFIVVGLYGCDPERRKKCEWYLIPDQDRQGTVSEGYIPVCARNFISNKQDCRLQTTLEFAQNAFEKKFRYIDLVVKSPGIPRTIQDIKFCNN